MVIPPLSAVVLVASRDLIQRIERLREADLPGLRWNRGDFLQTLERIPIITGGKGGCDGLPGSERGGI